MSGTYMLYVLGRWREVDEVTGHASCWSERLRFVYCRGGKLFLANTDAVLTALQDFAKGLPSAVKNGPPLVRKRKRGPRKTKKHQGKKMALAQQPREMTSKIYKLRSTTCSSSDGNDTPIIIQRQTVTADIHKERKYSAESNLININNNNEPFTAAINKHTSSLSKEKHSISAVNRIFDTTNEIPASNSCSDIINTRKRLPVRLVITSSSDEELAPPQKQRVLKKEKDFPLKELVIEEEDVMVLRNYIEKNQLSINLYKFDSCPEYKRMIFFKINPLVNLERCPRIARMLKDDKEASKDVSIEEFASHLGLAPTSSLASTPILMRRRSKRRRDVFEDSDFEIKKKSPKNIRDRSFIARMRTKKKVDNKAAEIVFNISSDDSGKEFIRKVKKKKKDMPILDVPAVKKIKRSSVSNGREYSMMEDQAIVTWVSVGERCRLVNGNRLWRELEGSYRNITGCERSWHSLRNRYLRYILPALSSLGLTPYNVTRLRAAAAAGEIKNKFKSRRNSIFKSPVLRSAWTRRPRPPSVPGSSSSSSSPPRTPTRTRPISTIYSPTKKTPEQKKPTNQKYPPSVSASGKPLRARDAKGKFLKGKKKIFNTPEKSNAETSPTYNEVTKAFAARVHADQEMASQARSNTIAPRTRRLYNPRDGSLIPN